MSHETQSVQPSWKEIVRCVWSKTKDDYRLIVPPRLRTGRTKLDSLIEVVGRLVGGVSECVCFKRTIPVPFPDHIPI